MGKFGHSSGGIDHRRTQTRAHSTPAAYTLPGDTPPTRAPLVLLLLLSLEPPLPDGLLPEPDDVGEPGLPPAVDVTGVPSDPTTAVLLTENARM